MATIRSYATIEQSKVLANILPLESADMCYPLPCEDGDKPLLEQGGFGSTPCWSLASLLDILPNGTNITKDEADTENEKYMCVAEAKGDIVSTFGNNPVDACYEMIMRLNELKML